MIHRIFKVLQPEFRAFGLNIKIDGTLSIFFILLLAFWPQDILFFLIVYLSVLFHEIGHAVAGKHFKKNIALLTINCLGGAVLFSGVSLWSFKEKMIISASGPFASLLLGLGAFALKDFLPVHFELIFLMNAVVMCGFNMLPVVPLDGGRCWEALCDRWWPYRGKYVLYITGVVVSTLVLLGALYWKAWILAIFAFIGAVINFVAIPKRRK